MVSIWIQTIKKKIMGDFERWEDQKGKREMSLQQDPKMIFIGIYRLSTYLCE